MEFKTVHSATLAYTICVLYTTGLLIIIIIMLVS